MKSSIILICLLFSKVFLFAQLLKPIGQWGDHVPFRFTKSVFVEGQNLTASTQFGVFTYSFATKEFERFTKSNGLAEVKIRLAEKDPSSSALLIAYENQNMDLIDNDRIKNIPDILNSKVQGDKTINNLKWIGKDVYISSNLGILVFNSIRSEIKATYRLGPSGSDLPIFQISVIGNTIYAATSAGLKKTNFDSSSMRNYLAWITEKITSDQERISNVLNWNNQLIVQKSDSIFIKENLGWRFLYAAPGSITCLNIQNNKLYVGVKGTSSSILVIFDTPAAQARIFTTPSLTHVNALVDINSELWIADGQRGVIRFSNGREEIIYPNSPDDVSRGKAFFRNNQLWTTAGRIENGRGSQLAGAFFEWNGNSWTNYTSRTYPFLDSMLDIHPIAIEPESGFIRGGSFGGGLFEWDKSGAVKVLKQNSFLRPVVGLPTTYRVSGLAYDKNQTLWISNPGSPQSLIAKTKQGDIRSFSIPLEPLNNSIETIFIDAANRKWILGGPNNGLACFDDGGTLDRTSDDRWRFFKQGKGSGNLPSSNVHCVTEDRNEFIWVGTDRGVAIIQCTEDVFNSSRCEAILPVVQQNSVTGVLLSEELIYDIKVDGADRKWIGSANGVWLLSADGQQVIYRFTSRNSPLLNNKVYEISINEKTGEVYFHTESGISVFRSTATEPELNRVNASVFPNPVPTGYSGTIAIRNLPSNAWVRIAELDGKLVYQTRSLGGQAIWNGRNYKGEKIYSGVYLVYISDENNQQQLATKIFFIQ